MGDDTTGKKLLGTSGAKADDEELRQLMVGLLKKMETLDTVGERLTRLEAGQQEILRARALERCSIFARTGRWDRHVSTRSIFQPTTVAEIRFRSSIDVSIIFAASAPLRRRSGSR
jgi:hypothetical protein